MVETQAQEWSRPAVHNDSLEQLMRILVLPYLPFLVSLRILVARTTGALSRVVEQTT
jgi:hypothetical protein